LALLYGGKKRYQKGKIKFEKFNFIVPDYMSFLWQYKEIFVDENYRFPNDNDTPVIYDCGSNVGTSCAFFKKAYPNSIIKAFEADPKISEILKLNIKKNELKNIEVFEKAVWINNHGVEINIEGADGSSIYTDGSKQKIESIRLKELLEGELRIDFLKMDIEGAENEVLVDCQDSLKNVTNIFIEYHSYNNTNQNLSALLEILENNSFRYFIKPVNDRKMPLLNRVNKSNPNVDLQLNIFGYKK
jgi:FkbM family methyltransferase